MVYGLYDTIDKLWMGDQEGPFLFDSEADPHGKMGEIRAMMIDAQFKQATGRTRVRAWTAPAYRLRDSKMLLSTALEAYTALELGL